MFGERVERRMENGKERKRRGRLKETEEKGREEERWRGKKEREKR